MQLFLNRVVLAMLNCVDLKYTVMYVSKANWNFVERHWTYIENTTAAFIAIFMCRPWKKFQENIRDGNNCLVPHKHVLRSARICVIFDIILQRD